LIAFADHDFALHARSSDGVTEERAHLLHAAKRGNKTAIAKLRGPELAPDLSALWQVYLQFQRWRGASPMGLAPMTLDDLDRFEQRFGYAFTPWEADVLKSLDLHQLQAFAPRAPRTTPTPTNR